MQTHPTLLVANWKMNGDAARLVGWVSAVEKSLVGINPHLRVVFCPPAPYITQAKSLCKRILLGGQNCHEQANGAYTGETSAAMLADCGAGYVILGHSERRARGEDDAQVAAKAKAAIAAGLMPILCVGESRADYDAGRTKETLNTQLSALKSLTTGSYLVAYEPVWAIGTSVTPQMPEISAAHTHIKTVLGTGADVLYGGSVNVGNIGEILALPEVSGALIGGASLEAERMGAMIATAATAKGMK